MTFRLVATEPRISPNGTPYDHTVWMGEFDSFDTEHQEAIDHAYSRVGPGYSIQLEAHPTALH